MLKALGEIKQVLDMEPAGDRWVRAYLRLRIEKEAIKAFKLPRGLKGRIVTITRLYPSRYPPQKGDKVILVYPELEAFIKGNVITHSESPVFIREGDFNQDGFPEYSISNGLVEAVVLPHRGARVSGLIYRGYNFFEGTSEYLDRDYIELGGYDDHIDDKRFGGSLYSAEFKPTLGKNGIVLRGKKCGFEIEKCVKLHPGLPIVRSKTEFRAKVKKSLEYWQRIAVRANSGRTLVYIPAKDRLEVERYVYHYFVFCWFRPSNYPRLRIPAVLIVDQLRKLVLLMCTSKLPQTLTLGMLNRLVTVEPKMEKVELKRGESVSFEVIFCPGEFWSASNECIAVFSRLKDGTLSSFAVADKDFEPQLRIEGRSFKYRSFSEYQSGNLWILEKIPQEVSIEKGEIVIGEKSYEIKGS